MKKDTSKKLEKQFARKFLNHVGRQNAEASGDLKAVSSLMEESPELRGFLEGPQFSAEEKKNVIAELLSKKLSFAEGTRKFLEYLVDMDGAALLPGIAAAAEELYMDYSRRAKAVVVSAASLDEATGNRLKTALGKITGREVEIEYVHDPSVLGGVLVKIGSTMFDSSLRGQLRILKEELIKG
ncbi:MAG: ATP synthase F1 subunit delta [Nitrospiraceae bacterium]|nr:ATP synthase F1 subunit delta [Nitrospiraceae bacterium]